MALPTQDELDAAVMTVTLIDMDWIDYAHVCTWNQGSFCTARYSYGGYEQGFPSCYYEGCIVYDNVACMRWI